MNSCFQQIPDFVENTIVNSEKNPAEYKAGLSLQNLASVPFVSNTHKVG